MLSIVTFLAAMTAIKFEYISSPPRAKFAFASFSHILARKCRLVNSFCVHLQAFLLTAFLSEGILHHEVIQMGVGSKLDALLQAKGKKAGTLARETGLSKNTIYSILRRDNDKVDLSILEKISANLGVSIDYFFCGSSPFVDKKTPLTPKTGKGDVLETNEVIDAFVSAGLVPAGQDLSDEDLRFLMSLIDLIEMWFARKEH